MRLHEGRNALDVGPSAAHGGNHGVERRLKGVVLVRPVMPALPLHGHEVAVRADVP